MTFLGDVAHALTAAGRRVTVDPDLSTIDVSSTTTENLLAVVRPVARAVTFYVVHPDPVPAGARGAVSELVVRATADLLDASLELDLATGSIATRFPVVLDELEPPVDDLADLLATALDVVETAAARYAPAIDDVAAGRVDARAAAVAVRTAPVTELATEVDRLTDERAAGTR